jgi:hypothetical protein
MCPLLPRPKWFQIPIDGKDHPHNSIAQFHSRIIDALALEGRRRRRRQRAKVLMEQQTKQLHLICTQRK